MGEEMSGVQNEKKDFRWCGRWFGLGVAIAVFMLSISAGAADERRVKTRVPPVYPEIAKRLHVFGVVKIEAKVDAEGKVRDVKTLSGNHILSAAAEDAVRKWKFVAGDGESTVDVDVDFSIAQ
jgi:TonB family protein